jgi:hypothetical protein
MPQSPAFSFSDDGLSLFPPDVEASGVPIGLHLYYHEIKPGRFAYVCPHCRSIFPPRLQGMPGSFIAHIRDVNDNGCWLSKKRLLKGDSHGNL